MPIPALAAAAAIGAGGGAINSLSQMHQNKKNRQFSREMYDRQKADNLEFWNLQNDYNSPQSQMNRFQEAGLNPHLIYGQGNAGNAGAISTPDVQTPQTRSPEWGNAISAGGLPYLMAQADLKIKQAQANNLQAQNSVILEDAMLRRAQTYATEINAKRGVFNLDFDTEFRDVSGEAKREGLRQLRTSTDLAINRDVREGLSNASNLSEALERIQSMKLQRAKTRQEMIQIRSQVQSIRADTGLKQLEIDLRKQGINPQDPMWTRVLGRVINSYFGMDDSDPSSNFSKFFKK